MVARNGRYSDRDFRRLFLWAIDECNPPPPEGLEVVAEFIETDQSALLRRIAEKEAERKERKHQYDKRRYSEKKANSTDSTVSTVSTNSTHSTDSTVSTDTIPTTHTTLPTNQPSLRPNGRDNAPAHAHAPARPTFDDVLAWTRNSATKPDGRPIPDNFAREWYALMEGATPPWTNTRGRSLLGNWRQEVIYAWKREQGFAARGGRRNANQPDGVIHHEDGYENPL